MMNMTTASNVNDFCLADFEPVLNNWPELNLRYMGNGSADFTSPVGNVAGPFVATYDEYGSTTCETFFEQISFDPTFPADALAFLTGAKPTQQGNVVSWGFGGLENPCRLISFSNELGTFESTAPVHLVGIGSVEGRDRLKFYVPEARWETKNSNPAKYFAIPLFNCVADNGYSIHGKHPLRLYSAPSIPDNLPKDSKVFATMKANERNSVIGFFVEGQAWFIERLPDFDDRLASLRSGVQRRITAVMIGEVGSHPTETFAAFRSWFPVGVLSVLGFGSGVDVGFPWMEIRDAEGALIRRLHGHPWLPTYHDGDVLLSRFNVDLQNFSGIGTVITKFLDLAEDTRSYLAVAMNHARLGSLGSHLHLYDILDHLIRALECICKELGFTQQHLLPKLSAGMQAKVRALLDESARELHELAKDARQRNDFDDARILETIASRTANAAGIEKKFGLAVIDLLKKFGLHDSEVIDRFIGANSRADGLADWASVLSSYRGATIHEGYMDFPTKHDVADVIRICRHLKDVIARVILKIVGYQGTYEPVTSRSYGPHPVDWVQATTAPQRLGFE
jgi:hypothetical protein